MNSLSEALVWAAGRSLAAGDLEMFLRSPTKKKNRDNKALIPLPDDGFHLTEQIIHAGGRLSRAMRAGPDQDARAQGVTAPPGSGCGPVSSQLQGCVYCEASGW